MRDFYLILNSLVALALIVLGIAVFLNSRKDRVNRLFFFFTVSVAVWIIAACVSNDIRLGETVSLYGNYLVFFFSYFSSYFLLWFTVRFTNATQAAKRLTLFMPPLILMGVLSATPLVVKGVVPQGDVFAIEFGPLTLIYGLLLIGQLLLSIVILRRGLRRARDARHSQQIKTILRALTIAIPVLVITQFIAPAVTGSFEITDTGILIMVLPVSALYISVARQGLFDIRSATVRTVGYVLTIAVMAGIYILLAYVASLLFFGGTMTSGVGLSPTNIAIALVLALIFQPIRQFFDGWTSRIFYRGAYNAETFIRNFGKIISHDTNLLLLLEQSSTYIREALGAERVFFSVNGRTVSTGGRRSKRRMPPTDIEMIEGYYREHCEFPAVLVSDLVESEQVRNVLRAHQVRMVLPLILREQVLGHLFIGEHGSRGYAMRDIRVIESIANELTIAIQNSLSVEEIRDMNETLQHDISEATKELRASNRQLRRLDEAKDEFISMASHQLRTPLTSIKGYLDMVLDGDLGKITATQRSVLSEAYISSERMVTLINDFLNVSRLQTGKFIIDKRETDMVEMLKEQVQMLSVVAKQHGLQLDLQITGEVPRVLVDGDKVRQVMLNMIDNAIYYSAPATTIDVMLARDGDDVMFSVKDTGIGVPESEKSGLFGKFFRASNARKKRPDGTGVGLFLSRKVILAHGGDIIFWSKEGKGSVFGFRVPIGLKETDDAGDDDSTTESDK